MTPVALRALSPREASIFACLCDTIVAPEPLLPAVRETDAVAAFDRMLAAGPALNRLALRALLYAIELAPRPLTGVRLRSLGEAQRARLLARLEAVRTPQIRQLANLVKSVAYLSYYGDGQVIRRLGYDPDRVMQRARALRAEEARP
jgi:hypothetical protein